MFAKITLTTSSNDSVTFAIANDLCSLAKSSYECAIADKSIGIVTFKSYIQDKRTSNSPQHHALAKRQAKITALMISAPVSDTRLTKTHNRALR